MEAIQLFALRPDPSHAGDSRLLAGGQDVGAVEGIVLEAQFRCRPGSLVVTSDGSPFEERLHLYLLDHAHERLDDVSLGRMYHAGMLRDVVTQPDRDVLTFGFFGGDRWRLTIAETPRWSGLSRPFSAVRRSRPWPGQRYLELRRD
jgi:hypothetical protein